jgi:hypothetical protein
MSDDAASKILWTSVRRACASTVKGAVTGVGIAIESYSKDQCGGDAEICDHLGKQGGNPRWFGPFPRRSVRGRVTQEDVPTNNQLGNLNNIWNLHYVDLSVCMDRFV